MLTLITNGHPLHEIGVKSLAGYVQFHGIPVQVIYMSYCRILHRRLRQQILEIAGNSKLIGLSLMTKDVGLFKPLINDIRQEFQIPVVLGGIHPTAMPGESLEFSDYVCVGEGEEPIRQLYSAVTGNLSINAIPNICYRNPGGDVIVNPVTYFTDNLDDLPYPDYKFESSYYYNQVKIESITPEIRKNCFDSFYFYSQRGCKLACAYCSNSIYSRIARNTGKKWYRLASTGRVVDELGQHLKDFPQIKSVTFNDDDFLARSIDEINEITSVMKREFKLPFSINGIPAYVTDEKIKLLVENGLKVIAFGVQSGSPRILKNYYRRPVTRESVLKAANIVARYHDTGLNADYGFILDNPYENEDEWLETLDLIRALPKPRTISLYSLEFFPGTVLTNRAVNDMIVDNQQFVNYKKDYRSDIQYNLKNTIIFIYSYFHIPWWLDSLLLSNFIIGSRLGAPARFLIAYPLGYLIRMSRRVAVANREVFVVTKILKKIWFIKTAKHYIKQRLQKTGGVPAGRSA